MTTEISNLKSIFNEAGYVILYDDSTPDERAVITAPANTVTPDLMNKILGLSNGGITSVAISPERAEALELQPMARPSTQTTVAAPQFCLTVEAREGVTTGISCADRATTINCLAKEPPLARSLVKPGHVFPIEVSSGGVLVKNALPEGTLDLAKIAGFSDAALFMDLLDDSGNFLNSSAQEKIEAPRIPLSDVVKYRLNTEKIIYKVAEAKLPTSDDTELRSHVYKSTIFVGEHVALVKGTIKSDDVILTRVQTEMTIDDVFGGPSRKALHEALSTISTEGSGVLLYLRHSSQGFLKEQLNKTLLPPNTLREYGIGAQILCDLGVRKVKIISNSKTSLIGLKAFGIEIVDQVPLN